MKMIVRSGTYGLESHGREEKWTVRFYFKLIDIAFLNTHRIVQMIHKRDGRHQGTHSDTILQVSGHCLDRDTFCLMLYFSGYISFPNKDSYITTQFIYICCLSF